MENLLVKLMLAAALTQLGMSASAFLNPEPKAIQKNFVRSSKDILRIDWKPISVFPDKTRRFQ